ncbi:hypothetical protein CEXT_390261 [Caerostris extrusa]|uniref:Uncharacterized protein n=1 Tax=Caerostris extrusa TaxID=172846 RepID=A0AAV4QD44_CAEEX|nr:hypothetical protein CEXT_390261 [Caerostris extrusa]
MAKNANVSYIVAKYAIASYIMAKNANVSYIMAKYAIVSYIMAKNANVSYIVAKYAIASYIMAKNANVSYIVAKYAIVSYIMAKNANVSYIVAKYAIVSYIMAKNANVSYIVAKYAIASYIMAKNANVSYIVAKYAIVSCIMAKNANVSYIVAKYAIVSYIMAKNANVSYIVAKYAIVSYIMAKNANVSYIVTKRKLILGLSSVFQKVLVELQSVSFAKQFLFLNRDHKKQSTLKENRGKGEIIQADNSVLHKKQLQSRIAIFHSSPKLNLSPLSIEPFPVPMEEGKNRDKGELFKPNNSVLRKKQLQSELLLFTLLPKLDFSPLSIEPFPLPLEEGSVQTIVFKHHPILMMEKRIVLGSRNLHVKVRWFFWMWKQYSSFKFG